MRKLHGCYKVWLLKTTLKEALEHFEHATPAAAIILTGQAFICEPAVRDFHASAGGILCQFPANYSRALFVGMPISDPGICQHARRVEFEDLAVAFKSLYPVGGSCFLRYEIPVAAAETSVHLPLVDRAVFIGE